jgi:2-oxoglutarate ferredoxin oxidoreductase subunit alpha
VTTPTKDLEPGISELERVTIRFAGDSGDGMQLTGTQFTRTAAVFGNDISTLPDFPAEIRAPAGSLPGVSGFQISFSASDIHTPGDAPDVLVAMNPAALKTNVGELPAGGALIVNSDAFTVGNLNKAAYPSNPLTDGSLKQYSVFEVPINTLNTRAMEGLEMKGTFNINAKANGVYDSIKHIIPAIDVVMGLSDVVLAINSVRLFVKKVA